MTQRRASIRFSAWHKLAATLLMAGLLAQPACAQNQRSETFESLSLFNSVLERVQSDYVEEVDERELIRSAIEGMLEDLDPHSGYLDPEAFEDMQVQTEGEFGGLGIEVTMEDGLVKVVSPIEGTPAYSAGVQPGDLITHIDGDSVVEMSLGDAVERMRGEVGTDITITLQRGEREPFDLTITRDTITIQSVRHSTDGNVGYIRINTFNEQTTPGLEEALSDFDADLGSDLAGIVVDVRNNPGGLLEQAVSVSDMFLSQGEIVATRGRTEQSAQRFDAGEGEPGEDVRLAVLVNGGSASASEILAGAIQDHRRGVIMGTSTFGKGSVQTVVPLPGDGAMRLTTARYYTPSGRSIDADGIEPDITIEQGSFERADADNAGDGDDAGSADSETGDSDVTPRSERDLIAESDYQLQRALDLVRGVGLFTARTER